METRTENCDEGILYEKTAKKLLYFLKENNWMDRLYSKTLLYINWINKNEREENHLWIQKI